MTVHERRTRCHAYNYDETALPPETIKVGWETEKLRRQGDDVLSILATRGQGLMTCLGLIFGKSCLVGKDWCKDYLTDAFM